MTRAAEKLRQQSSVSGAVHVSISTSLFQKMDAQYKTGIDSYLPGSYVYTLKLAQAGLWGLKRIYRSGYRYAKAGVMSMELAPANMKQACSFVVAEKMRDN
tara:strand:- start:75 stop:377 length:303 start_codon:yes stop_codon:yes gene_type:complete